MAPTRPYRSYATGKSSGFVTVAEGPGMAAGQLFVHCCAHVRASVADQLESRFVKGLLLTDPDS